VKEGKKMALSFVTQTHNKNFFQNKQGKLFGPAIIA
jgi:hypothetical protein